jgi:hypothetical protein
MSLPNDDKKDCPSKIMSPGVTIDQVYQEIGNVVQLTCPYTPEPIATSSNPSPEEKLIPVLIFDPNWNDIKNDTNWFENG